MHRRYKEGGECCYEVLGNAYDEIQWLVRLDVLYTGYICVPYSLIYRVN